MTTTSEDPFDFFWLRVFGWRERVGGEWLSEWCDLVMCGQCEWVSVCVFTTAIRVTDTSYYMETHTTRTHRAGTDFFLGPLKYSEKKNEITTPPSWWGEGSFISALTHTTA